MAKYYDGTKILSLKDLDGERPEIYLVQTNRTGGKTTYFSRLLVNRFKKNGDKFCLLYRFSYELSDVSTKFFKDINGLFFPEDEMSHEMFCKGKFARLFLNGEECGYAIAMNDADMVKKYSHFFSDVQAMFFDEFQSETNHYCFDELNKFQSIHTSIARGQGEQSRYVPVYMCSNSVTILNPYYTQFKIASRLRPDTKFLRGHGWVLESGFIKSAQEAAKQSGFNRAFAGSSYQQFATESKYLNDNSAFVEKMSGNFIYWATLLYGGKAFSVKEMRETGLVYIDTSVDTTCKLTISLSDTDFRINSVMVQRNHALMTTLRTFFRAGRVRFKNLEAKECFIAGIGIY